MVQIAKKRIVEKFADNDLLLTSHGFESIVEKNLGIDAVISEAKKKKQWLVSHEFLAEFIEQNHNTLHAGPQEEAIQIRSPPQTAKPEKTVEPPPESIRKPADIKEAAKETRPGKPQAPETEHVISTGGGDRSETAALLLTKKPFPAPEPEKDSAPFFKECLKEEPVEAGRSLTTGMGGTIFAKDIESRLKIRADSDVTGRSTCEGKLEDFVDYFNEKYNCMKSIIKQRSNYGGAVPIEVVKRYKGEKTQIVGIVNDKTESKNGFRFLDLEDPTGDIRVLIPKDKDELNKLYMNLLTDQVIGVEGKVSNELFIASDIVEPDIPLNNNHNYANEPVHAALMSDIHVGSNLFLEKEFERFLDWINLKGSETQTAEKVKYIIVAGDLVDGIGIYPGQENELVIPDIYKQYDFLANLLEKVPDYIDIVLAMGNHDAVRGAEPQPALPKEEAGKLAQLDNVILTGNPVSISMHGVNSLVYHGTTIDTVIANLSHCSYSDPEIAMIEYLKKRHLAPKYGNDKLSPERKDYMAINEVPDIFHAGHVHKNGYATYRGVKVINSGTWQARTSYQEEQGHMPSPALVPVINLQNHEITVKGFSTT